MGISQNPNESVKNVNKIPYSQIDICSNRNNVFFSQDLVQTLRSMNVKYLSDTEPKETCGH